MFSKYSEMFKPICEFVKTSIELFPYGNHTTLHKTCYNDSSLLLELSLHDSGISERDKKKAEKIHEFTHDVCDLFLGYAVNPEWISKTKEEREHIIELLIAQPQVEQRTPAWYLQATTLLTASEFSTLFGSVRQRATLAQAKANPSLDKLMAPRALAHRSEDITAMNWGVRFEPVVKQILCTRWNAEIREMGRLVHPTDPYLAASPDGLIVKTTHREKLGRLVEIKCPYSRKIGGEVPFDYEVQMQIQMEVADIDECEYVECEILSLRPGMKTVDLSGCKITGELTLWENDTNGKYTYVYEPCVEKEGWTCIETIPWGLMKLHNKVVHRDRAWFASTHMLRTEFWNDVVRMKEGNVQELPKSNRNVKVKVNVCKIEDNESTE